MAFVHPLGVRDGTEWGMFCPNPTTPSQQTKNS
jgi:hypothetical protein